MDNNSIETSLAFFVIVAMAIAFTTTVQRGIATPSSVAANSTNTINPLTLGNPYFVEYDKTTSQNLQLSMEQQMLQK